VLTEAPALGSAGYMDLAFLYLREGRAEDALRATDRALEVTRVQPLAPPDRAKLLAIRGNALAQLHRPADAVAMWKESLALDPHNPQARAGLDRAVSGEVAPRGTGR
jgi:tetratricopeptide (TPR) repeat protein